MQKLNRFLHLGGGIIINLVDVAMICRCGDRRQEEVKDGEIVKQLRI
jgi:hypothetical protein